MPRRPDQHDENPSSRQQVFNLAVFAFPSFQYAAIMARTKADKTEWRIRDAPLDVPAEIIACLLISLWTGRKPTLRTHEMICYSLMGAWRMFPVSHLRWLGVS